MKPDVAALLDVQAEDLRIYDLEDRLAALAPRLAALEQDRQRAVDAVQRVKSDLAAEEKRQRDVQDRLRQHREQRDKSENLLGQLSEPRAAAAAMAQIEQAKRFISDEERDLESLGHRLTELRNGVAEREASVAEIERVQEETRATLDADRAAIEKELGTLRTDRERKASTVPRSLLQRYDRIRSKRRETAIFPLRGTSCARCDTSIPVQRHSTMVATGATEVCEACGVLLYAADG